MAKLANSMPHVVILLESTYPTHTQILRGILRFTQLHAPWTLDVRTGRAGEPRPVIIPGSVRLTPSARTRSVRPTKREFLSSDSSVPRASSRSIRSAETSRGTRGSICAAGVPTRGE